MPYPKYDNIRGLVQDLSEQLDLRMVELRESSPQLNVRPADAKMFMLISRQPRSVSQLAKVLEISRQAAHASIKRLIGHGVIELDFAEGNNRDKLPTVTEKGHVVRQKIGAILVQLESEISDVLGAEDTEVLRGLLKRLVTKDK